MTFNYLSTDQDRREWVEAIRVARGILTQPAFDPFNAGELSPGPSVATDEQILEWVANDGETALHPSCTAKMGTDDLSVVDPLTMKVHGLDGLRVVDASVMPYVTNGNIYAPVMMVAEKAADLILGATPLPAEPTEFYRHKKPRKRSTVEVTGEPATTDWGSELTHILVVRDIAPAVAFYRDVLGATVLREYGGTSCVLQLFGTWLLLVTGGDPTDDKPTVTFEAPADPDRVSHSMTFRVPDCRHAHEVLSARGARSSPRSPNPTGRSAGSSATPTGICWRSAKRRAEFDGARRAGN